jgi:hypothetical protein
LRFAAQVDSRPGLVALVGGASSGKSTIFNNLLGGHLASRIAARGHTTLGPILAAHEARRAEVEAWLEHGVLLPGLDRITAHLDADATGEVGAVVTLYHTFEALRDVLLLDLPDFTSQDARHEGDITKALLSWFDRLVVVVDHERWFDRQSVSGLHAASARYGQRRWVIFNRARTESLAADAEAALAAQAGRLGAEGMNVLASRQGRGFRLFPPGTLDRVSDFVRARSADRSPALRTYVAEAANRILNQNEERAARRDELQRILADVVDRTMPSVQECVSALMTAEERRQVEFASRVLRLEQRRQWLVDRTRRLGMALRRVPVVGALVGPIRHTGDAGLAETTDRGAIAMAYFEAVARHQVHEIQRIVRGCAFWEEIRRWTGLEPIRRESALEERGRGDVEQAAQSFDVALGAWLKNVETQCEGFGPYLKGAVGVGGIGLAVVLIAVPGPVAALTLASAQTAIGAALVKLVAAAGTGALAGQPLGRLRAIIEERLLGSPELDAVRQAASGFLHLLEAAARRQVDGVLDEAGALVLDRHDALVEALSCLRDAAEESA